MRLPLMIVHDFDLSGSVVRPNKAQTPLAGNPDAVLALSVVREGFQTVSRRNF